MDWIDALEKTRETRIVGSLHLNKEDVVVWVREKDNQPTWIHIEHPGGEILMDLSTGEMGKIDKEQARKLRGRN